MIRVGKSVHMRCFLLRPTLVSFADGTLPEPARSEVEQHLTDCSQCTEDVVALREIPAVLRRRTSPAPDEQFWARQRDSIVRAVQAAPAPRDAPPRTAHLRWLVAAAAAAALLMVVRLWYPAGSVTPATAPVASAPAASAPAGDQAIATLVNEAVPMVPEDLATLDDAALTNLRNSLDEEIGGLAEASLI